MSYRYITLATAIAATLTAMAQEQLSKEITIEREIVPEVHAASRPAIFPTQLRFTAPTLRLDAIDYGKSSEFGPHISTLEPAATEPAAPLTPYRGYVEAGYFPIANVGVSAGYSIISKEATRLNVWGQFNNRRYDAAPLDGLEKETFSRLQGRIGIDFAHRFTSAGTLGISTDFNISAFNQPWSVIGRSIVATEATEMPGQTLPSIKSQNVLGWNIDALWNGKATEDISYHIGAKFDIYNFSKGLPLTDDAEQSLTLPALHQSGVDLRLGVAKALTNESAVGIDAEANWLHYNSYLQPYALTDFFSEDENAHSGKTVGIATLTPYYRLAKNIYSIKIGARIDFTINSGKKFHIAPDVLLGINPAEGFGASLRLGGGEKLNSLQELAQFSPYICQSMAYGVSNRPITADLALRFGPLKGASLTLDLDYAAANNWLLPYSLDYQLVFAPSKIRSLKAGATARWTFRRLLALEAKFETVIGSGNKNTWIEWRDRARRVLTAGVEVTPLRNLSVNVAYEWRMKRSMPVAGYTTEMLEPEADTPEPVCFNLKNMSNLNIGAAYRFTEAFTVFARVENVLNATCYELPFVPAQGINGLIGVGFKF